MWVKDATLVRLLACRRRLRLGLLFGNLVAVAGCMRTLLGLMIGVALTILRRLRRLW